MLPQLINDGEQKGPMSYRVSAILGAAVSLFLANGASAQTTQRPLSDFVVPSAASNTLYYFFDGEDSTAPYLVYADFFGKYAAITPDALIRGTITETALADGRARVHVQLRARDVYADARSAGFAARVLGHSVAEVVGGAETALADVQFSIDFINVAPGAPLPAYSTLVGQNTFERLLLVINAAGPLRAAFGVAEGTPGAVHVTMRGLLTVPGLPNNGEADAWPAEKVIIKALN